MSEKNTGGSAFQHKGRDNGPGNIMGKPSQRMTLRDWFAGQALVGLDVNPHLPNSPADATKWPNPDELAARRAKWAYVQADAMLEEREK